MPQLSKHLARKVYVFPVLSLLILSLPHFATAARKGEIEIRVVDEQTQQPVAVYIRMKTDQLRGQLLLLLVNCCCCWSSENFGALRRI